MFNNSRYNEGQHKQSTSSSSQPWKNQDYNSVQGPPQQSTGYGERHYQFQYPQHQQVTNGIYHIPNHQRGWGKRAHEYVASASSSATSSMSKSQRKTSPTKSSQQSQLNRHKSLESSNPFQGQKNKQQSYTSTQRPQQHLQSPQKKKNPESHTKYLQNYKDKQWTELFTKALKELTFCESGKEVNVLLTFLQPSRSSWIKIKDQIYNDLLRLLKPLNVEKLLVFGSTLTGLDFVGSDLDYHVQLKCPPIESDDVKDIVNKTAKLTRNYQNQEFRVIYTITSARVPIIRLLHQRTKITCDINFTSQFGYYNSCFIGNVLCYDCRIKDLAVILKLWSKSHKIAEKMIISNYCLIMLMIFYLQNLEHPMLDTIKKNQESREPRVLDPKYKWNFYFNDSINKAQENQLSTRQLLVGFFEFYHKMNFDRYVVSLYNGDLILRQEFDTHPDLKLYRETVEESKLTPIKLDDAQTFIVQDGFELNLNIGIKCKKNVLVFFELIKASFAKCTELNAEPFSTLLMKLFTDIKLPESSQNSAKTKKKFLIKVHSIAGDLKLCQDILCIQDKDKVYSSEDQKAYFFKHCFEATKKFLQEVYLCTLVPMKDEKEFNIILHVDTINGRKKMSFKDDSSVNAEINLSRKMSENKVRLDLDINMKITSKDAGKSVDFEMIDNNLQKKSTIQTFGNLFSVNIPQALKFYLKKNWEEATSTAAMLR